MSSSLPHPHPQLCENAEDLQFKDKDVESDHLTTAVHLAALDDALELGIAR